MTARDLEARQDGLGDAVPEGAAIEADTLLEHMVVSEVVSASSEDAGEEHAAEAVYDVQAHGGDVRVETGAGSISELVRQVAVLPPVVGALRGTIGLHQH